VLHVWASAIGAALYKTSLGLAGTELKRDTFARRDFQMNNRDPEIE